MANYYGFGRTNTFAVKDIQALRARLGPDFTVLDRSEEGPGRVSIFADDGDGTGFWSRWIYSEDDDNIDEHSYEEPEELYVPDVIAEYLQDGQVAVFMHAGAEKQRYIVGYAVAVGCDGRQVRLSLDDIYEAAATAFGVSPGSISSAMY